MEDKQSGKKRSYDLKTELLKVSARNKFNRYINVSKAILAKFRKLELSSLGSASATSVQLAEYLQRNGLAEITDIRGGVAEDKELNHNAKGNR